MRRASNDCGFIIEDDTFFGVSLGYDYCAEHEWGIEKMKSALRIPSLTKSTIGLKSRTINLKKPENIFVYIEDGKYTYFFMGKKWHWEEKCNEDIPSYVLKKEEFKWISVDKDQIITAWSDDQFGILVKGKNERKYIKELYDASLKNKIAITHINLQGKNPFANASLSILLVDKLPVDVIKEMEDADKQVIALEKIKTKLNMQKRLEETGKFGNFSLIYCGPKFINYGASKKELNELKNQYNTKHEVRYWLNSSDVYGWFTVEQLEKFIKDKNIQIEDLKNWKE
jgi:hypothetical protein